MSGKKGSMCVHIMPSWTDFHHQPCSALLARLFLQGLHLHISHRWNSSMELKVNTCWHQLFHLCTGWTKEQIPVRAGPENKWPYQFGILTNKCKNSELSCLQIRFIISITVWPENKWTFGLWITPVQITYLLLSVACLE